MAYHVNPTSGEVSPCRARKSCPFGDLVEEHYASPGEARKAYEGRQRGHLLPPPPTREASQAEEAAHLLQGLQNEEGNFVRPPASPADVWKFDEDAGEYVRVKGKSPSVANFTFINSGISRNVYRRGAWVYKVPNDFRGDNSYHGGDEVSLLAAQSMEVRAYESLDHEVLRKAGVTYLPTTFLQVEDGKGHRVPMEVQPYLDPEEYELHELPGKVQAALQGQPLWDLHKHNVWKHRESGEVILLDCLKPLGKDGKPHI